MFMRYFIFYVSVIIFLHACSSTTPDFPQQSFRSRLSGGDRHMGWSLNYFDSWQNGLQPPLSAVSRTAHYCGNKNVCPP